MDRTHLSAELGSLLAAVDMRSLPAILTEIADYQSYVVFDTPAQVTLDQIARGIQDARRALEEQGTPTTSAALRGRAAASALRALGFPDMIVLYS
ncbi:hypothetical protein C5E10_05050 [Pseudoclavibacter sp. RFBG4]|uniref:hypothetical protein n=1 Tax=Pseudoclavibacter sp. RFBG4 TaxID=2080575 RepID=UPI000CE7F9DC|nr:hypothetical protein [Pseudoclavibacter sp. RFBG4]PPG34972.1 hypothetical protein C5E10_05050 [Pseudoclavibacter sp. RFBG4]